eukprot:7149976-Prymnesium_polylepis.1
MAHQRKLAQTRRRGSARCRTDFAGPYAVRTDRARCEHWILALVRHVYPRTSGSSGRSIGDLHRGACCRFAGGDCQTRQLRS